MNKLKLMKNPEIFQGEKKLKNKKNYFEGWYFKNSNCNETISFIPGIYINNDEQKAFIQVITNLSSYYVEYKLEDFTYHTDPFYIKIQENYFSKESIHINIRDRLQKLKITGDLKYINSKNIKKSGYSPNIMGPFSYIPFMECNHAILTMQNDISGKININQNVINLNDGVGYIEKDWGISFPKNYIWCQANQFSTPSVSLLLSIADIPFKLLSFRGFICVLLMGDKEYRFTTYNCAKIIEYDVEDRFLNITLKKGAYELNIRSVYEKAQDLVAPMKGDMVGIKESVTGSITITLVKDDEVLFSDTSVQCGLEIVNG